MRCHRKSIFGVLRLLKITYSSYTGGILHCVRVCFSLNSAHLGKGVGRAGRGGEGGGLGGLRLKKGGRGPFILRGRGLQCDLGTRVTLEPKNVRVHGSRMWL